MNPVESVGFEGETTLSRRQAEFIKGNGTRRVNVNSQLKLHYIYDPFCGWCYGAAPLLSEAAQLEGVKIVPHSGGMLSGEQAQLMSAEWREFVRPHEERISAPSGQKFGAGYTEEAQFDYTVPLDSGPPSAAMVAAEELAGAGLSMLKKLQIAYYVEGRPIATREEILRNAAELGLDTAAFAEAFDRASRKIGEHFEETHKLLAQLKGQGYPTLAIERNGVLRKVHLGQYFGKPGVFREALRQELESVSS